LLLVNKYFEFVLLVQLTKLCFSSVNKQVRY
jgi:hypothetical protein